MAQQENKKKWLIPLVLLTAVGAGGLFTTGNPPVRDVDALRLFASGALFGIFLTGLVALIRSRRPAGGQ